MFFQSERILNPNVNVTVSKNELNKKIDRSSNIKFYFDAEYVHLEFLNETSAVQLVHLKMPGIVGKSKTVTKIQMENTIKGPDECSEDLKLIVVSLLEFLVTF